MCSAGGLLPAFPTCFATPNLVEMFAAVSVCTTILHLYHTPSKEWPWTRFPWHFIMCSGRIRLPGSERLCVCWVQDGEADKCQVNPEQGRPCTNNSAKQMGRNLKPDGTLCEGRTYISCACTLGRPQWGFNGRVRPLGLTENQQQFICFWWLCKQKCISIKGLIHSRPSIPLQFAVFQQGKDERDVMYPTRSRAGNGSSIVLGRAQWATAFEETHLFADPCKKKGSPTSFQQNIPGFQRVLSPAEDSRLRPEVVFDCQMVPSH